MRKLLVNYGNESYTLVTIMDINYWQIRQIHVIFITTSKTKVEHTSSERLLKIYLEIYPIDLRLRTLGSGMN